MRSADKSAVRTIGAREDGEIIARIRNRRCYGGADWRHLGHAGARRRRRQAGQGKERKRRPDARHNGGSHWENGVKRQHGFDPQSFNSRKSYALARIAAVTARTARGQIYLTHTVFNTAEFLIFVKYYSSATRASLNRTQLTPATRVVLSCGNLQPASLKLRALRGLTRAHPAPISLLGAK
jgi:hypothetical protein